MSAPGFTPRPLAELTEEWPSAIDHISASSMKMLARCPEQWRQRYVLGIKKPPEAAQVWGGADHKAIEHTFQHALDHKGQHAPVAEVKERFVAAVDERIEESGGFDEVVWRGGTKKERTAEYDDMLHRGQALAAHYRTEVAEDYLPVTLEEAFSIELPGIPVPLIGWIDLTAIYAQLATDEPQAGSIIDRKTSAKSKRGPEADWLVQAMIYQLVKPLPHEWHVSVKNQQPKVQVGPEFVAMPRPEAMVRRWLTGQVQHVGYLYNRYGPDHPWPGDGLAHPWACSYCAYAPGCPHREGLR